MPGSEPAKTQQKIINAATKLFSEVGYNGVSTRDIGRAAGVNESSMYRHFPHKRDLFVATLDSEFSKVRLADELISKLAAASDSHAAILALFEITTAAVLQQSALIRLVHFSVLEFGHELDDLYRRHLGQVLEAASEHLARWPELAETNGCDVWLSILAFIATLVTLKDFYPVLAGNRRAPESLENAASSCAGLWHAVLAGKLHASVVAQI